MLYCKQGEWKAELPLGAVQGGGKGVNFGIKPWRPLASLFYLNVDIQIVPAHTGLLKELSVCASVMSFFWAPMNCGPPGSSVHGILQAGILEWVAISSSRGSSWPRDQTHPRLRCLLHWQVASLPLASLGKVLKEVRGVKNLTQCFAHRICTLNKSQPLLPESDFFP